MLLGSITEVKEGWRDRFEDGEREEIDRGLRAKREGRNMSWLTPFQGLGYAIICLFPFICRRKEDFCNDGDFSL